MRVVADASVVAKWYFPERGRSAADRILEQSAEGDLQLLAPDVIEGELVNVLWKKVRRGECDEAAAQQVLDLWETDRPPLVESQLLSRRALGLALRLGHPVYDCLYLAAAIEYQATLATADARLASVAGGVLAEVFLVDE